MYISHQGLKAMQDHRIGEFVEGAELQRKMPLKPDRTARAASPIGRITFSFRQLTSAVRRTVARV
jgi:hypothetical protein